VAGSLVFREWTLDYLIALLIGVTFQYAALSPMLQQTGPRIWWRALKVDFLSLSAWQVGMYGWMALVIFVWFGPISPTRIEFWFLDATGHDLRLFHCLSHELVAGEGWHQDRDVIILRGTTDQTPDHSYLLATPYSIQAQPRLT
jgi:hypothetical protein